MSIIAGIIYMLRSDKCLLQGCGCKPIKKRQAVILKLAAFSVGQDYTAEIIIPMIEWKECFYVYCKNAKSLDSAKNVLH